MPCFPSGLCSIPINAPSLHCTRDLTACDAASYQKERLNRGSELTVVHESLLEEDNADEGEALLADSEKVPVWRGAIRLPCTCARAQFVSGIAASALMGHDERSDVFLFVFSRVSNQLFCSVFLLASRVMIAFGLCARYFLYIVIVG